MVNIYTAYLIYEQMKNKVESIDACLFIIDEFNKVHDGKQTMRQACENIDKRLEITTVLRSSLEKVENIFKSMKCLHEWSARDLRPDDDCYSSYETPIQPLKPVLPYRIYVDLLQNAYIENANHQMMCFVGDTVFWLGNQSANHIIRQPKFHRVLSNNVKTLGSKMACHISDTFLRLNANTHAGVGGAVMQTLLSVCNTIGNAQKTQQCITSGCGAIFASCALKLPLLITSNVDTMYVVNNQHLLRLHSNTDMFLPIHWLGTIGLSNSKLTLNNTEKHTKYMEGLFARCNILGQNGLGVFVGVGQSTDMRVCVSHGVYAPNCFGFGSNLCDLHAYSCTVSNSICAGAHGGVHTALVHAKLGVSYREKQSNYILQQPTTTTLPLQPGQSTLESVQPLDRYDRLVQFAIRYGRNRLNIRSSIYGSGTNKVMCGTEQSFDKHCGTGDLCSTRYHVDERTTITRHHTDVANERLTGNTNGSIALWKRNVLCTEEKHRHGGTLRKEKSYFFIKHKRQTGLGEKRSMSVLYNQSEMHSLRCSNNTAIITAYDNGNTRLRTTRITEDGISYVVKEYNIKRNITYKNRKLDPQKLLLIGKNKSRKIVTETAQLIKTTEIAKSIHNPLHIQCLSTKQIATMGQIDTKNVHLYVTRRTLHAGKARGICIVEKADGSVSMMPFVGKLSAKGDVCMNGLRFIKKRETRYIGNAHDTEDMLSNKIFLSAMSAFRNTLYSQFLMSMAYVDNEREMWKRYRPMTYMSIKLNHWLGLSVQHIASEHITNHIIRLITNYNYLNGVKKHVIPSISIVSGTFVSTAYCNLVSTQSTPTLKTIAYNVVQANLFSENWTMLINKISKTISVVLPETISTYMSSVTPVVGYLVFLSLHRILENKMSPSSSIYLPEPIQPTPSVMQLDTTAINTTTVSNKCRVKQINGISFKPKKTIIKKVRPMYL